MANFPTSNNFQIISTIRSDAALLYSAANSRVNFPINRSYPKSVNQFYMLGFHQDRMIKSARAFGWGIYPLLGRKAFIELVDRLHDHLRSKYNSGNYAAPLMLRIAFSVDGRFTITSNGPHPLPAAIDCGPFPNSFPASHLFPTTLDTIANLNTYLRWRVFVTFSKVTPSLFTQHKTSNRRQYEEALAILPARPLDFVVNGVCLQPEVLIVNERWEIMEGCRFTPYFWRDNRWVTPALHCGGNEGTTRRWALMEGLCVEGVVRGGSVKYDEIIVLSNGAKGFQSGIVKPWMSLAVD